VKIYRKAVVLKNLLILNFRNLFSWELGVRVCKAREYVAKIKPIFSAKTKYNIGERKKFGESGK